MRFLVLQTQADAPPGHLIGWAAERGHGLDVRCAKLPDSLPAPGAHDAMIALGSDASMAHDTPGWAYRQLDWLRAADELGMPTFGICFGAQALAAALGGAVKVLPRPEIGWVRLAGDHETLIPNGPWFTWHEDFIELPRSARELARNQNGPQAFSVRHHLGVQFHPEATAEIVNEWLVPYDGPDRAALLGTLTPQRLSAAAVAAYRLFDGFLATAGLTQSEAQPVPPDTSVPDHMRAGSR
jgi:GMP synthase-like glutamine amidotransferase